MKYPQATLTNEALAAVAEAYGLYGVTDTSLLRLILQVPQDEAQALQRALEINLGGGVAELPALSPETTRRFRALLEWHSRFITPRATKISGPNDLVPRLQHWANDQQENFLVALMNGAQHLQEVVPVTRGLLNRTLIHPREIFAHAIAKRASAVILAHNHPSGHLEVSREDKESTVRMIDSGKILGIEVLDHVVFTDSSFVSMRETHPELWDRAK